jgi:hypothetical protein
MGFKYNVSACQLAKGELCGPGRARVGAQRERSRSKIKVKFWLLLAANVVVFGIVWALLTTGSKTQIRELLTVEDRMVSGIAVRQNNRTAVVHGEVVREGETVDGCKILRIYPDRVVMEKDGQRFARWMY